MIEDFIWPIRTIAIFSKDFSINTLVIKRHLSFNWLCHYLFELNLIYFLHLFLLLKLRQLNYWCQLFQLVTQTGYGGRLDTLLCVCSLWMEKIVCDSSEVQCKFTVLNIFQQKKIVSPAFLFDWNIFLKKKRTSLYWCA